MTIAPTNFNILVSTIELGINAAWMDGTERVYDKICQATSSGSSQNVYPWIGMVPKMRLWNGPRFVSEPALQTYALANQTFELTMGIDRFTVDDDQFGYLQTWLPFQARQAARQPDYMLRDMLENTGDQTGTRQLGMDGLSGFSTQHAINFYNPSQGVYSNDFGGGGQTITYNTSNGGTSQVLVGGSFSPTSFMTMFNYMRLIKGEDSEPLGINPNFIQHAQFLKGEVSLVLKSQFYSSPAWGTITGQVGSADSPTKRFGIEPIENVFLNNQYTWYMLDTNRGFRPFIHQTREATRMVPRVAETDPAVFDQHTFLYGQWDRQAVGWGPAFTYARSGP